MASLRYVDRRVVVLAFFALAVELWLLLFDVHLFWRPPRVSSTALRVARVQSVVNQAKVRSPLQLNWFDLTPGQDLFEGDEVATVGTSSADLEFVNGQSVRVASNSFLVLGSSGQSGGRALQISLVRGGLQQDSSWGDSGPLRSRLEIDVGGRQVVTQGQSTFRIESSSAGAPTINVSSGNVSVSPVAPSTSIEISAPPTLSGQAADLIAPVLKTPAAASVLVNPVGVALRWKCSEATWYSPSPCLIEVSRDEAFSEIVLTKVLSSTTQIEFVPERKGRYFWRVTRVAGGRRVASQTASFEVRRELLPPALARPKIRKGVRENLHPVDAPVLERPVINYLKESLLLRRLMSSALALIDEMLVNSAAADEAPAAKASRYTVELNWEPVAQASAYVLQIAADEQFAHVIAEKLLAENSFIWRTDLAGFFYWRVAGVDRDGDRGPFSEFMTFTIKAQRNQLGDNESYDTYLEFDGYSKHPHSLRFLYGPVFRSYYFSSEDAGSPSSVIFRKHAYLFNGALSYDYRLSPYYSLQFLLRVEKSEIEAMDYESRAEQTALKQYEKIIGIGVERRFFEREHYFSLQTGVRVSFIDMPVLAATDRSQLEFDHFGFFGLFLAGGYHKSFSRQYDGALNLGVLYQHTGDSYRASQFAALQLRRRLGNSTHLGIRIEQVLAAYRFNSDNLAGNAHSLTFRPALFIDVGF